MKRFTQLLTLAVFCSLTIFTSCKKKGGGTETKTDVRDAAGNALMKTWVYKEVTNTDIQREEWSGFAISFSYNTDTDIGSYQVSGVPADEGASNVWGSNVTWEFGGTDDAPELGVITRSDGINDVNVSLNAAETEVVISFIVPDPDARLAGFDGDWVFTLTAQ